MNEPNAISIKRVTKFYRGRAVLKDLSFEFPSGGLSQIVGKNGSGKSTMLRVMAGATKLDRGSVRFASDVRRSPIGFVPQRGGHYPDLSLRDNALLISSAISSGGSSLLERPDLLAAFQLAGSLDRPLRTFSEGMRRIVTFLAVWAARPRVLFADEPFAGVDPDNAGQLMSLLTGNEIGAVLRVITAHEPMVEPAGILDLSAGG